MPSDRSWSEIDLDSFAANIEKLKKLFNPDTQFMQIVKADAYGLGAFEIAQEAIKCGCSYLGVANTDEGMLLRYQGIKIPILILSPALETEINRIREYDLEPAVSSLDFALELNKFYADKPEQCHVHLNIDSGMGRSGIPIDQAKDIINRIRKLANINIKGIFSHYAASENDPEFTSFQKQQFKELIAELTWKPEYIHIANSSGVVTAPADFTNLVRLGLLSYGVYPDQTLRQKLQLEPVMTFKTRISYLNSAEPGQSIGYNRTFMAKQKTDYAILPVGYADGYDFLLSNRGVVQIGEHISPVLGKISMDMIAVDVTDLPSVHVGDEVILLGKGRSEIRVENLAALYSGSAYELLCQTGRRAKRYYCRKGSIVSASPLLRRDFVSHDYSDDKLNLIIESAIEQRLQSKSIANLVYQEILERLFTEKDRKIHYRENFNHIVEFRNTSDNNFSEYYEVNTKLTFNKVLENDFFYVVCARNEKSLEKYFLHPQVEYRWLFDDNYMFTEDLFRITQVSINGIELKHKLVVENDAVEIRCWHPELADLIGERVHYSIATRTYYPRNSHQMAIYLIEMTKGINLEFHYHDLFSKVEAVPIFSGNNRYPMLIEGKGNIKIHSEENEWIFPNSGVVFVY